MYYLLFLNNQCFLQQMYLLYNHTTDVKIYNFNTLQTLITQCMSYMGCRLPDINYYIILNNSMRRSTPFLNQLVSIANKVISHVCIHT